MKHLKIYETFIDEYFDEIKRLKKDAIDKLTYTGTTLIDDFGFEVYKKGFSFVKSKVINFYTPGKVTFTPELNSELKRMRNRLKEFDLGIQLLFIEDAGHISREDVYSEEFANKLIGKVGQAFVFVIKK